MKINFLFVFLFFFCINATQAQVINFSSLKEKSVDSLTIYLKKFETKKDLLSQAYCYKYLAEKNFSNKFLSVKYSLEAIKLFKNTDPEQESWQKLFLANSFSESTDGLPAIEYAKGLSREALNYSLKSKNDFMLMSVYQSIIRLVSQSSDSLNQVDGYLKKCQILIDNGKIKDPVQLMVFEFQKGKQLINLKKYDEAINLFRSAALKAEKNRNDEIWLTCQLFIAQNLRFVGRNIEAYALLNDTVAGTILEKNSRLTKWRFQELALVLTNLNRIQEANKTWEKYFYKQVEIEQSLPSTFALSDAISYQLIENQKVENEMIMFKNKNYQKALVIMAILVFGTLVLMFLRFKYQKLKLESHKNELLLQGQEIERDRLGSKLHDIVGSTLATIKNNLNLQKNLENPELLIELVDDAYLNIRDISHQMYPKYLKDSGLELTVRDYINLLKPKGLVSFKYFGTYQKLPMNHKLHIFRIIQELVINALKHSNASKIEVELNVNDHEITIDVIDDGRGFNKALDVYGIGLSNVQNRVYLLNGTMTILENRPMGAHFSIIIPSLK